MLFKNNPSWPQSHHDIVANYYAQYDRQIATGEFQPYLYPWGFFGGFGVIAYLLIPHQNRPWLKKCRFLAFAWIVGFAAYSSIYTKARGVAPALGLGLVSAWGAAWISAILICNDAQTDFMRIERTEGTLGNSNPSNSNISETNSRAKANGTSLSKSNGQPSEAMIKGHAAPRDRHGPFAWQPYPLSPFIERLDWVLDIFCNFRGAGWNWRTSAIPPLPKWLQEELRENSGGVVPKCSSRVHSGQVTSYPTRRTLLIEAGKSLIIGYLMLDGLKTMMMHDPYFWGLIDRPPPLHLPLWLAGNPVLLHIFRMTLSMLGVKYALQTIYSLAPLLFAGLMGDSRIGARAEPWIYPETWGHFSIVIERGLAGWWSGWWHQTFRFAFEQPSAKMIEKLGWDRQSVKAKALQLVVAFGLSGIVHASGSYTAPGETKPLEGTMAFFMLQAMGIFVEVTATQALNKTGVQNYIPKWLMNTWTFVYVHAWFYFTAHLLCDDFSRGGIWLFDPVPVSLFRALGLGADKQRDGWWCWTGRPLRWHQGDRWWRSGLAF